MTSLSRQKDGRAKFPAKNISFLITIPESSTTKDTHLKVPSNFVKKHQEKYRKQLSEVVYFKLPCGRRWEIEVTEKNGHFWFEKGWEKFSKYYSLQSYDKLIFQYERDSIFKVNIFDHLAKTEIDYPIQETDVNDHSPLGADPPLRQMKKDATPGKKDHSAEKNDKGEAEADHPIKCSNMQENVVSDHSPPASSPLPQTKKEATPSGGKNDLGKNEEDQSRPQRSPKPATKVPLTMPSSAKGGQATALQRAEEFKSRNPSCFLVTMQPSYIKGDFIWLSSESSRNISKYLGINSRTVGLCVVEGRKRGDPYTVELTYDTKRATFKFQSGWHDFARANELNAGDVCGFMLIGKDGLLFEVNIIRETVVTSPAEGTDEDDVDDKDDNGNHDANDDYAADDNAPSSFKKVLPNSMSHCLWLCSRFSRKYLRDMPSTAELRFPGRRERWSVGLKYDDGTQRSRFQSNWTEFVKDNKLKIGDECEFVLTDENKPSFDVVKVSAKSNLPPDVDAPKDNCKDDEHIKNEDEDDNDDNDDDYDEDEDEDTSAQLLHKRKRLSTKSSIKDVGVLTSTRKSLKRRPGVPRSKHSATGSDIALPKAKFTVVMTSSDIRRHCLLLPPAFVKEHLDNQPSHVSLWGSDDMYWPVETQFSKGATSGGRWTEFVHRHNLKEGDVCVFELTEERKCLFDVHHCRTL